MTETSMGIDCPSATIGDCTIYHGDCMEIIPSLGDFDLVLTDPPYGINIAAGKKWDNKPQYAWSSLVKRHLKDTGNILCFGSKSFSFEMEKALRDDYIFRNRMIWLKNAAGFQYSRMQPRTQHDDIIWVSKSKEYYFNRYGGKVPATWSKQKCRRQSTRTTFVIKDGKKGSTPSQYNTATTVFKGKVKNTLSIEDRTLHPSQKPTNVMIDLQNIFCPEGGIVLDPFMGSGTSGIAAIKTGRKFIGIEQDKEYFEMSVDRLKKEYSQPDLFV